MGEGRGCSTVVERIPHGREVAGLNCARCWDFFLFIILPIVRPYFRSLTGNTTDAPQQMQQWQIKLNMLRLSPKIIIVEQKPRLKSPCVRCWSLKGLKRPNGKKWPFSFSQSNLLSGRKIICPNLLLLCSSRKPEIEKGELRWFGGKNAMGSLNCRKVVALVPK